MTNTLTALIDEMKTKMGGYAFLMKYRFIHFSVKSDPAVMLATEIIINQEEHPIEEVADVAKPNEYQLAIIPKDSSFILPIIKAIKMIHPEYKIEKKEEERDHRFDEKIPQEEGSPSIMMPESDSEDLVNPIIIICTMPEVNEDRKDAGMEYVKINFDGAIAKIETAKAVTEAKLAKILIGKSDANGIETWQKEVEKLYNQHKSICESLRKEKENEIEEAFQMYMEKEVQKQEKILREQAANGEETSKSMKLDPFLQDE